MLNQPDTTRKLRSGLPGELSRPKPPYRYSVLSSSFLSPHDQRRPWTASPRDATSSSRGRPAPSTASPSRPCSASRPPSSPPSRPPPSSSRSSSPWTTESPPPRSRLCQTRRVFCPLDGGTRSCSGHRRRCSGSRQWPGRQARWSRSRCSTGTTTRPASGGSTPRPLPGQNSHFFGEVGPEPVGASQIKGLCANDGSRSARFESSSSRPIPHTPHRRLLTLFGSLASKARASCEEGNLPASLLRSAAFFCDPAVRALLEDLALRCHFVEDAPGGWWR